MQGRYLAAAIMYQEKRTVGEGVKIEVRSEVRTGSLSDSVANIAVQSPST